MKRLAQRAQLVAAAALAAGLLAAAPSRASAADWPQWRGPTHDGLSTEASGYPAGWPPAPLWRKNVGKGCTSPILAAGCLYVMGYQGVERGTGTDTVFCLDARSGRELWKQSYPCPYHSRQKAGDEGQYGGPSSTPTFDPATGYLYTLSTDGHLICWNTRQGGKPVWQVNFYESYPIPPKPDVGRGRREYGYPQTPLLLGDRIIVEVGSSAGTVMAFDKRTGKRVWRSQATEYAGHSSGPAPLTVEGKACLATLALRKVIVLRNDRGHEGETVGEVPWQTDFANNIATPAAWNNCLVVTSSYNVSRTALVEVTLKGLRERWRVRDHSKVSTPVVYKDRVFMCDGSLTCLDVRTGRRLWSGGKYYHGSCLVTTGDEKLIAFGAGRLAVVDPLAEEYRELSHVEGVFQATCYPHLALADGILAVKDMDGNLMCFDTRRRAQGAAAPTSLPAGQPTESATETPARPPTGPDPHDAKAPRMAAAWPGNTDGLVFLWADAKAANRAGSRACTVKPRGNARTDDAGEMVLGEGAMLAQGADAAMLEACRASNTLAIEALITPADANQEGPARIISFSADPYRRNVTLGQEGDRLLLRLRTPATGANGMEPQTDLCGLSAGRRHHVIVSYTPGRLVCYLDGKRVVDTNRVRGDFSNWEPMHLLFGDEWQDARMWKGRLSGLAIHSRVIGAQEAARRYELATQRAKAAGLR